jgi:hypothetical protein
MDTKNLETKIDQLKTSIDILILIEFCKRGASRDGVREVFGSLDNNLFSKVNKIINNKAK